MRPQYHAGSCDGGQSSAGYEDDGIYRHLLAIFARTAAIDDEKRRFSLECDQ